MVRYSGSKRSLVGFCFTQDRTTLCSYASEKPVTVRLTLKPRVLVESPPSTETPVALFMDTTQQNHNSSSNFTNFFF